jgi:hypothetical protein
MKMKTTIVEAIDKKTQKRGSERKKKRKNTING